MNKTVTMIHRRHAFRAALAGILMLSGSVWAAAEETIVPEGARPMTGVELHALYRDKSWRWPDGAARMQDDGRVLQAWSGSGEDAAWAEGRWIVTNSGRLCLQADWHSREDTFDDRTCFRHMTDGETIFQRKEPSGEWYIFRHAEPQEDDEFAKLVREDLVSANLEALRNSPQQPDEDGTPMVQSSNGEAAGELR